MPIRRILIENIRYKRRLREVNNERVLALANSIDAIGLQVPVTVYKEEDGEYVLVAGLHRLKAAQRLGWDYVSAEITSLDELDRKLWGIDENLCRAELTALERAQHLQLRQEIWSARRSSGQTSPETAPGVGRPKGFATTTEQATGIPKRTINQDIRRADEILADFQSRIAGTRIAESGVELEALASARPEQQREAVQKVLSSEAETVREIIVSPDNIIDDKNADRDLKNLRKAWDQAGPTARLRFLQTLYDESHI